MQMGVLLWDMTTWRALCTIRGEDRLWDASTGQALGTLSGATERAGAVAFGPEGRWLAAQSGSAVRVWDLVGASRGC